MTNIFLKYKAFILRRYTKDTFLSYILRLALGHCKQVLSRSTNFILSFIVLLARQNTDFCITKAVINYGNAIVGYTWGYSLKRLSLPFHGHFHIKCYEQLDIYISNKHKNTKTAHPSIHLSIQASNSSGYWPGQSLHKPLCGDVAYELVFPYLCWIYHCHVHSLT